MNKKNKKQNKESEDEFIEIDREVWARFKSDRGE